MKDIVAHLKKISLSFFQQHNIAVDIGTAATRIAIEDKGIVLREPTFVGRNVKNGEYLFFGKEAKDIYGKSPNFIEVIKPFDQSIISDFDSTYFLIREFLKKSVYPFYKSRFIKKGLTAYGAVPTSSTEVEQKALVEALIKAGFSQAFLIERPVAAALGAGLPIFSNSPYGIIDIGAGSVEMAFVIMGGVVGSKVLPTGGDHMDKLIHNYLHLKYGVIIGELTAEQLKNELFNFTDKKDIVPIRGKSLENGLPKSVRVSSADISEALSTAMNQINDSIKELVESTPPEIIDGLIKNGITLTGQLAAIPGIDKFIMNEIKIPVMAASKPEDATVMGILKLLKTPELAQRSILR